MNALLDSLKESKTLKFLDLSTLHPIVGFNRVDINSVESLSSFLGTNEQLTTLYLGFNLLGAQGAAQLVAPLKLNTTLTSLAISTSPQA